MSTGTDVLAGPAGPDVKNVRDRADVRRQVRFLVIYGLAALVLLGFALSIDNPTVAYSLAPKFDINDPPRDVNGLRIVWITFAITALALVAAVLNRIPRSVWGALISVVVGLSFYVGLTVWYFADQTETNFFITNPLPNTIQYAVPLVLGALAGSLCERSGVINIAIEGQFLAGAFFASVTAALAYSAYVGLLGGAAAGVAVAAMLAFFALRYQVNQIVLGVVLIALAGGLSDFLLGQIPTAGANPSMHEKLTSFETLAPIAIPGLSDIPLVGDALFNQTILAYIAMVSIALVWFLLYHTTWGLRVRSVGEHPKAADTVGIRVNRMRWQAVLLGGVFAGLGGAYYTAGSTGAFTNNASGGEGFMALAAVIMGRWHPVTASLAALFFGLMLTTEDQFGVLTKFPTQLLAAAPYIATLIAIAGFAGRVRPPAANGEPYVKS
ncbi:MAG: ABC transporter permease [Nocardioides sp.]|nr:ABC transporter permease [Nocardioides sp.]